jgi:glucose-6-phosphate isomerase
MLPSAFAGLDLEALRRGASEGVAASLAEAGASNPARELGVALAGGFRAGLSVVDIWAYGELCHALGLWLQQLWAESLGRRTEAGRVGPTPLVCRGSEDQHSLLQLAADGPPIRWALFLTADGRGPSLSAQVRAFAGLPPGAHDLGVVQEALWRGTLRSLGEAGVPTLRLHLGDAGEEALGEAMATLVLSTLWAAALLGVDPFGQPGVESGKRHTLAWLESRG